jgi:predicted PolB exonuclease-like 3'-5' exonuclease
MDLMDRPIAAFDIETIPDPELGRRLLDLGGTDAEVIREMVRRRLEETNGGSEYPQLPWHRVVSVCVTVLDLQTGSVAIRALGKDPLDERSHVDGFFRFVEAYEDGPRLVSWNGGGFDLPVLRYRAMKLGVQGGTFYRDDEARRANGYQNRYHDLHVDLMDLLSGYGASARAGLGTLASLLGLPGKMSLNHPIYDHVLDGEGPIVTEYCKHDTALTLLLFLVWAFHTGGLGPADLRGHVAAIRSEIGKERAAAWRTLEGALADWPAWDR